MCLLPPSQLLDHGLYFKWVDETGVTCTRSKQEMTDFEIYQFKRMMCDNGFILVDMVHENETKALLAEIIRASQHSIRAVAMGSMADFEAVQRRGQAACTRMASIGA